MAEDYYSLLGVSRSATADEIKKAFRTKAHQFHPDKTNGDAEKFKKINEAYQVLGDQEKRQQYDQYGQTFDQARRNGGAPGGNPFGGFGGFQGQNVDFGDLGDMFGDIFGFGGSRSSRQASSHGRDIVASLTLPFRTAVFGGERTLTLRRQVVCSECHGTGAEAGSTAETCATCQGRGQVQQAQRTILGVMQTVVPCPDCHGEGKIIKQVCKTCRGEGRHEQSETITVKIPAGIDAGQKIKLSGKGEAGRRGAPAGDLFISIEIEKDRVFTRQQDDILTELTIPLSTAVLGDSVMVETLDGKTDLKIPSGTASGEVVVLKGKGVPRLRGRGRGDQRVTVTVEIPKKVSGKAKKLLQQLREEGM